MSALSGSNRACALFLLYTTTTIVLPAQTFTVLHTFDSTDGASPYASLVQGTDGNLYGTTRSGGAHNYGTVFRITLAGSLTTLHSFCSRTNCADGEHLFAGLIQGSDGNFYGTTGYGGSNGSFGTIFKISPSGKLTTLHSFCSQSHCTDGYYPYAGLIQGTDGNFYGATEFGGGNSSGTIFKITPTGVLTTLHSFCSQAHCADGLSPYAGLVQDTNGKFYGTAQQGGSTSTCSGGCGTVFSLSVGLGPFVITQPTSGKPGQLVKILGTNLTGSKIVTFNGTAAVFKVVSSSLITATVPAHATTGEVRVTPPSRTLSSNVPFRVLS